MKQNEYFDQLAASWDDNPQIVERSWLASQSIIEAVPLTASMKCLEIGGGTGRIAMNLAPWVGQVLMIDASRKMVATAAERIVQTGLTNLQAQQFELDGTAFPDGQFDLVYSSMAFHHILDIAGLLGLTARHQVAGGHLCIIDLVSEDGSFHAQAPDVPVHKGFDPLELAAWLETAGYAIAGSEIIYHISRPQPDGSVRQYPLFMIHAIRK